MLASFIERLLFGGGGLDDYDVPEVDIDRSSVFLWLSDSPTLNDQSLAKLMQASDMLALTDLVIVGSDFDAERFDSGKVYFLNTQKLSQSGLLTKGGDDRRYTIWDTFTNTQREIPDRFYVIIDEAHRGMKMSVAERQQAASIIQRFLVGHVNGDGSFPPANIVVGVTATPARFDAFLRNTDRIKRSVKISTERTARGWPNKMIILGYNEGEQPADRTLLEEACDDIIFFDDGTRIARKIAWLLVKAHIGPSDRGCARRKPHGIANEC